MTKELHPRAALPSKRFERVTLLSVPHDDEVNGGTSSCFYRQVHPLPGGKPADDPDANAPDGAGRGAQYFVSTPLRTTLVREATAGAVLLRTVRTYSLTATRWSVLAAAHRVNTDELGSK